MPLNENAINEILPFATDGSVIEGDLMSLDEYIASNLRRKGHQTGVALRSVFNRHARQTGHMSAGLAQFIANQYPDGVVDDGDIDKVEAGIIASIKKLTRDPEIRKYPTAELVFATPGQTVITPGFELDLVRDNVALFIDGIKQARGTYTYTITDIILSEPLAGGESIEVFSADITPGSSASLYTSNNLGDVPDKMVAKNNLGISEAPIGTIVPVIAAADYIPNGCLPCNQNEYTRAAFTDFYDNYLVTGKLLTCTYGEYAAQVAATGNCAKFAIDTIERTFKTPLIKNGDSITQAASTAELGKSYKAGLPDINGHYSNLIGASSSAGSGALKVSKAANTFNLNSVAGAQLDWNSLTFTASESNAIFGNSTTVTDEQVRLRHFVVVASSQLNNSAFNWSNYLAGLAGKANLAMDNLTAAGKAAIAKAGMPGSTTVNISLGGAYSTDYYWQNTYADGDVTICFRCNLAATWSAFMCVKNMPVGAARKASGGVYPAAVGADAWLTLRVKKGDYIGYNMYGCYPYTAFITYVDGES